MMKGMAILLKPHTTPRRHRIYWGWFRIASALMKRG